LGVHNKTVGRTRDKLTATEEIPQLDATRGDDGRTRRRKSKSRPAPSPPVQQGAEARTDKPPADAVNAATETPAPPAPATEASQPVNEPPAGEPRAALAKAQEPATAPTSQPAPATKVLDEPAKFDWTKDLRCFRDLLARFASEVGHLSNLPEGDRRPDAVRAVFDHLRRCMAELEESLPVGTTSV
jgi:hypothetical protein